MLESDEEEKSEHSETPHETEPQGEGSSAQDANSQVEEIPAQSSTPPSELSMSEEKVNKIKSAMSKLNLTPPPWAKAIPEEKWLNKILYGSSKEFN